MKKSSMSNMKPFVSVLIIILTLFLIVFVKMESRRVGYEIWKESRVEKKLRDEFHETSVALAEKLGPGRIDSYARSELDLRRAHFGQIIRMTQQQVALKQ